MTMTSLLSPSVLRRFSIGLVLDFAPIFIFVLSFHHFHVYKATLALMGATLISVALTWIIQKRLPYMALAIASLTIIFGYITVSHHQPRFIQMKDTMYDAVCALVLLIGLMGRVLVVKFIFQDIISMTTRAWYRITYAWIAFFIIASVSNEIVRRTMTLGHWFEFKTVIVMFTIVYGCIVMYAFYEKEPQVSHHTL
jgi:intracellular septation protein